ncbi:Uncharacterised protein [BD1-7 clade bacterium]|uniref:Suppressor of fused-like domain-containing protein n=1 Tax=BD1-7 clade bacterium TaxID=2029982 RepID=A0A5S9QRJ0_9GAMM|nr:Uncharacterised protein [BD1-7 clade bacterium]
MLEASHIAAGVKKALEAKPDRAERFVIKNDLELDFLVFKDRPYEGVSSIITNGVSDICSEMPVEFIVTYDPNTLSKETDLLAFLVTYIKLHYLKNTRDIKPGHCFSSANKIIKGLDFNGIYTSEPCYFPEGCFKELNAVTFLWLIPIFCSEYEFILNYGHESFESFLEHEDPDLSIFNRSQLEFKS